MKLTEGARVRLKNIRQPATVRRILANGLLEVDAGFLRMQVAVSDVEEVLAPVGAPAARPPVSFRQGPSFDGSFREINLIGQRAEEACAQVDKLLDSAALAEVDRIRIIHGHGMGILKKAVAELLARHPHVEKFYVAPPEEGGSGATIVELKTGKADVRRVCEVRGLAGEIVYCRRLPTLWRPAPAVSATPACPGILPTAW